MFEFNNKQVAKLSELRGMGIDPYPNAINSEYSNIVEISSYRELDVKFLESISPRVYRGRLRFKNEMGGVGFGRMQINGEIIQFCIKKKEMSNEKFNLWKRLDLGDYIMVVGSLSRTRSGELTVMVSDLNLLTKCISSMPSKTEGLTDPESRQRMRYLDIMVNPKSREIFINRSKILAEVRNFLIGNDFIEVETPILQNIPGGANARPFVTHHNALDADFYLRIAPELYLKRMVVGGFERVFEIGKNFRNEGISTKHNPEFTMVEFYQANIDYIELMENVKNLIIATMKAIKFPEPPIWNCIRYEDAIRSLGIKDPWDLASINHYLESNNLPVQDTVAAAWDLLFSKFVEPNLLNPTFVTHFPVEISPLAKKNNLDPRVTDRFELYIKGMEIANGFNELNDPLEQAERFMEQVISKNSGNDEAMYFDDDYIRALTYGLPPTAGAGIGIDRLVMLLTNADSIRDVILFPAKK